MYSDYMPRYNTRNPNISFYENKMPALPSQAYIDDILWTWPGDYELLESNHLYIQWLFPIEEQGLNEYAYPLKMEEARQFQRSPILKDKMKEAFQMMLQFYGMKLTKDNQFTLTKDSDERLKILNRKNNHNFQRITRILKSLHNCGHEDLAANWLQFLGHLVYYEKKLDQAMENFQNYWVKAFEKKGSRASESRLLKFLSAIQNYSSENKNAAGASSSKTADYIPRDVPHNPNISFYENKMPALPSQAYIDDILQTWPGDYELLESNHLYIQWLFPIEEQGLNEHAYPLKMEEAKQFQKSQNLKKKMKEAFQMMLQFYGMNLTKDNQFTLTNDSDERLKILNRKNNHNFQRITRILKSLHNCGHEDLAANWLQFLRRLVNKGKLDQASKNFKNYWVKAIEKKDTRGSESNSLNFSSYKPNYSSENKNAAGASSSKTAEYQKPLKYPKHSEYPKPTLTFLFYQNEIPFEPNGVLIEDILRFWKNDDKKLEKNLHYMYWLFPFDHSKKDHMLTEAEIETIKKSPELNGRVQRAFEMMLNFYGMKLESTYIFRVANQEKLEKLNNRYNYHFHHITSILLTLQNLGYGELILPWMKFLADLIYRFAYLSNAKGFFENDWKFNLKECYRQKISDYITHYKA